MDIFNQLPALRCFVDWQGMGREGGRAIKWATGVHHEMLPDHVMSSAVRASSEQIASKADRSREGGREGRSRVRIEWLSFLSIGANQRQSQYKDLQQNRLQIASVSERIEGTRDRGMHTLDDSFGWKGPPSNEVSDS